jgi:hypothetical protein
VYVRVRFVNVFLSGFFPVSIRVFSGFRFFSYFQGFSVTFRVFSITFRIFSDFEVFLDFLGASGAPTGEK